RPLLERALLEQISAAHRIKPIDVFFSYFYSAHCTPAVIKKTRGLGIRTVNWYCNASYQLDLVAELAPAYDLCLVPEKERLDEYRRLGASPVYCQEAANPGFYKNLNLTRDLGIVFVGANYATRAAFCRALYDAGLPLDIWGNGWSVQGGPFSARKILRSAKRQLERLRGAAYVPRRVCHGFCSDQQMV